jgi:hypothetical protein
VSISVPYLTSMSEIVVISNTFTHWPMGFFGILRLCQYFRLHRDGWYDDGLMMNWEGFGRRRSWPNRGTFPDLPGGTN